MIVETVCCSALDCAEAEEAGAHRIELCSAIELGGLTPSLGLFLETKQRTGLPIMVMIRPRPGGFIYNEPEVLAMFRDVLMFRHHGADGFVFGCLHKGGGIDRKAAKLLINAAEGLDTVMHRAFDFTSDAKVALDIAIEVGFTRVLTGGHSKSAAEGTSVLRSHVKRGDIEILAGGGIRPDNVEEIVLESGVSQVHLGPFIDSPDASQTFRDDIQLGQPKRLDKAAVRAVVEALRPT